MIFALTRTSGQSVYRVTASPRVMTPKRRRKLVQILALLCIVGWLGGCESGGEDLNKWLRSVKARKAPKVEPLPAPVVYEPVPYQQHEERTPFEAVVLSAPDVKPVVSEISPDFERQREPLEEFALSELTLVGTLVRDEGMVALVKTPQGEVVRVKQGNYMGRNFGLVEAMDQQSLVLREIVKDDSGRWQKRSTAFGFAEPGGG
ncbi:MAG: pilus assembly protein PilP [Gammaproteobacteria bacterium]|nr:pilus assembly protein PilP [Gammaproteobacteria bacterium]